MHKLPRRRTKVDRALIATARAAWREQGDPREQLAADIVTRAEFGVFARPAPHCGFVVIEPCLEHVPGTKNGRVHAFRLTLTLTVPYGNKTGFDELFQRFMDIEERERAAYNAVASMMDDIPLPGTPEL